MPTELTATHGQVFGIIEAVAAARGKAKEMELQRHMDNELLVEVLRWALDPAITFGVKKLPPMPPEPSEGADHIEGLVSLLQRLSVRDLSGNAAKDAITAAMAPLNNECRQLLTRVLLKDLRAGFSASTVNKLRPGTFELFSCMLAAPFKDQYLTLPAAVEEKFDGIRALAFFDPATMTVVLKSRDGNVFFNYGHIEAELVEFCLRLGMTMPHVFDGEIVSNGNFKDTTKGKGKKGVQDLRAKYWIFDSLILEEFKRGESEFNDEDRRALLKKYFALVPVTAEAPIGLAPRSICHTMDEILAINSEVRSRNGEGVIVKRLDSKYVRERSRSWLKIKPQETRDLRVVGFYPGEAGKKFEHTLGGCIVDNNGVQVNVGGGYEDPVRDEIWSNKEKYLGALMEVEFHEETPDGSLRHPRFVRWRFDKPAREGAGS